MKGKKIFGGGQVSVVCVFVYVCVYTVHSVKPSAVTKSLHYLRRKRQANPGTFGEMPATCLAPSLGLGTLRRKVRVVLGRVPELEPPAAGRIRADGTE